MRLRGTNSKAILPHLGCSSSLAAEKDALEEKNQSEEENVEMSQDPLFLFQAKLAKKHTAKFC